MEYDWKLESTIWRPSGAELGTSSWTFSVPSCRLCKPLPRAPSASGVNARRQSQFMMKEINQKSCTGQIVVKSNSEISRITWRTGHCVSNNYSLDSDADGVSKSEQDKQTSVSSGCMIPSRRFIVDQRPGGSPLLYISGRLLIWKSRYTRRNVEVAVGAVSPSA